MGFPMHYDNSSNIMEELSKVTPSYAGINYERIEKVGIHWPCPDVDHPGTPILHTEKFNRGKGLFHSIDYIPPDERTDEKYPMYLTTGRVLYQYHTGTMTMKTQGLNECAPGCFVEISPQDAHRYNLKDNSMVGIVSRRGDIKARVSVSDKAVEGTIFIPFHFAQAAVNRLTNAALDPVSGIPEYKVCAVKLEQAV
jgi:predicted molibdopterin-dependent oxidoreductase YjgC